MVVEANISGQPARVLYLDNAASTGEFMDGTPAFAYINRTRVGYGLAGSPQNALVIGVAGGTEVEDIKRAFPHAMVDGVDIDPRAVDAGRGYFSLKDDERTSIIIDDARRYIRKTDKTYGLVLIDAFRGRSIPYHLATKEFLTELKGRMGGDGIAVANIISSLEGRDSGAFVRLYNTFSSVFTDVVVVPVGNDPGKVQNIVLIATDRDTSAFRAAHAAEIYGGRVMEAEPLTDELNPIELFVSK